MDGIGGALLGTMVSLFVTLRPNLESESLALIAASIRDTTMTANPPDVGQHQRRWVVFHPTRVTDDDAGPDRGFFRIRSEINSRRGCPKTSS